MHYSTAWAEAPLKPRGELNWRYGHERAILMSEFWVPFAQSDNNVLYGDIRIMGDDHDQREGNLGIGYRKITQNPVLGDGVAGVHGWIDHRKTKRNAIFYQATLGAEWLGEDIDLLANAYIPLSDEKYSTIFNPNAQAPAFAGTGIVIDTDGIMLEEPQYGFDVELGVELGRYIKTIEQHTDSIRLYGGGYIFDGDRTERMNGWKNRLNADITNDIQLGARFQRDDERGSQGFLEATIRFPFGNKKSYRAEGLRARLDESPERDIDIVVGDIVADSGSRVSVLNQTTGEAQEVLHVDNQAAGGGDGSIENPFNTLADAQGAASAQTIIYVHRGDGTTAGQNQGVTLSKNGQQLIGSGTNFIYDESRFTTSNGAPVRSSSVIQAATAAPVITNGAGDGITVSADNTKIAGITIDGATQDGIAITADNAEIQSVTSRNNARHGVYGFNTKNLNVTLLSVTGNTEDGFRAEASGTGNSADATLANVTATGNKNGVRFYAQNDASLEGSVTSSTMSANTQHGAIIYDDSTAGTVNVDLGGGSLGSTGQNVLAANTLEDLAVDLDGDTLFAQNNWWGQASGPDTDNPGTGIAPQIYYGAPVDDGLIGHWTFDAEWTSNTTAYDRSGQGNDGTLAGGLVLADQASGQNREGLNFNGTSDYVSVGASSTYIPGASAPLTIWSRFNPASIEAGQNEDRLVTIRRLVNSSSVTLSAGDTDNVTYFAQDPGAITLNDSTIATGTSHSAALSNNGANMTAYVDATADSNVQAASLDAGDGSDALIGSYNGAAGFFTGLIDDVRLYNRGLSAGEISELNRMDTSSTVSTSNFLTAAP